MLSRNRKITMIIPVPVPDMALEKFASQLSPLLPGSRYTVDFTCPRLGGATLDSYYEGTIADMFCLEAGVEAAARGADAICVYSMSDSAVPALRSRLDIPVIGAGQSSYLAACLIGRRFSVITMWDEWRWFCEKVLTEQGLSHRLASIRSIGVRPDAVELLEGKEEVVFPLLEQASRRAIEEDGADVLVLGSTTMHDSHRFLARTMPVPVINPGLAAFKNCQILLDLGLAQSKIAYRIPEVLNDDILRAAISGNDTAA